MLLIFSILLKVLFIYIFFIILWKYRFFFKLKMEKLIEKNLLLKLIFNMYVNCPLFIVTITILLTTYILFFLFYYTDIIYKLYDIVTDLNVEKSKERVDLFDEGFSNKDDKKKNVEYFLKNGKFRNEFRFKRLLQWDVLKNNWNTILKFQFLELFFLEINKLYEYIINFYSNFLLDSYFNFWKIFILWLKKNWPGRIKERDGMSSYEWYTYFIGRFRSGLDEKEESKFEYQINELEKLRQQMERREEKTDQDYVSWIFITKHPEFFRYFFYRINSSNKKKRGFILHNSINKYLINNSEKLKKGYLKNGGSHIIADAFDPHSFLYKTNFMYKNFYDYRVLNDYIVSKEYEILNNNEQIKSLNFFKKILKSLEFNDNEKIHNGCWKFFIKGFFYNYDKIIQIYQKKKYFFDKFRNNKLKEKEEFLYKYIFDKIINFWDNKKKINTFFFEIKFIYFFLKRKLGLKNFTFDKIDWAGIISTIIYLFIGWM